MTIKLKLLAAAALVGIASQALAVDSVWTQTSSSTPNFIVTRAKVTSGTTPSSLGVLKVDPTKNVTIYGIASAIVSASVNTVLKDGTLLASTTLAVSSVTPISLTYAKPLPFEGLRISLTTAQTSTNNTSVTVIQY